MRRGTLAETALALAAACGATTVTWASSYDARGVARDRDLQAALEEAGLRASIVHDAPAVAPEEIAAARGGDDATGYRSFAAFLAVWNALPRAAHAIRPRFSGDPSPPSEPLPTRAEFDARTAGSTDAGDAEARFEAYLAGPAVDYATARNVPAGPPTARLSAALSFGTISARSALARLGERSRDPFLLAEERLALDALVRSLARRDFFLQLAWFFENDPDAPLQRRMRDFDFAREHPALDAWRAGATGYPLVDAGMRELATTGRMHPRVRAIAASFLCFDLGIDWRVGRDAWDALLEEDEPALASGNWQWIAGVGADLAQVPRIYNPRKQARRFDPSGRYVRRFVPELAALPDADLFGAPGERPQLRLALFGDAAYPAPIVDHDAAARAFLRRYVAFAGAPPTA